MADLTAPLLDPSSPPPEGQIQDQFQAQIQAQIQDHFQDHFQAQIQAQIQAQLQAQLQAHIPAQLQAQLQAEEAKRREALKYITTLMVSIESNLIQVAVFFYMILLGLVASTFSSTHAIKVGGAVCLCAGCTSLVYALLKIRELKQLSRQKADVQPLLPQEVVSSLQLYGSYIFVGLGVISWIAVMIHLVYTYIGLV